MKGGRLHFKATDVLLLAQHANKSKEFVPTMSEAYNDDFSQKTEAEIKAIVKPALHFVKDQGVYLMSNGKPGFYKCDMDAKIKKDLLPYCKEFKIKLTNHTPFWRDRVSEYVLAEDMSDLEFAKNYHNTFFKLPSELETLRLQLEALKLNHHHVVYAERLNPHKDDAWYDIAHHICGGDDFVENVPVDFILSKKSLIENGIARWFVIELEDDQISFIFSTK